MAKILHLYRGQAEDAGMDTCWFRQHAGAEGEQNYPDAVAHPSRHHSSRWKAGMPAKGPVGLLIQSIMRAGMQVSDQLVVWQKKE